MLEFSYFVFAIKLWCIFSPSTTPQIYCHLLTHQCLSLHDYLDCSFCKLLWVKVSAKWNCISFCWSLHHIALHICGSLFSIICGHIFAVPFLRAISCVSPRQRGQGSQQAVTVFTQTLSRWRQPGDWFSFLRHFPFCFFFIWPCALFILSISLSSTDLWDQPSKTDSEFFTDHECVSSYATEVEMETQKGFTNKYVAYL